MIILKKMTEAGFAFHNIHPVPLHLSEETTTTSLCTSNMEGIETEFKSFVEVFLVKVYRCKICAFTSSLKIKMNSHMESRHKPKVNHQVSKMMTDACHTEDDTSYNAELDMDSETKADEAWSEVYKHLCNHESSVKTHKCPECDQSFLRIDDLNEHVAKHKETRLFLCQLCGQTFKCGQQKNKHYRQVHRKTQEKRRVNENSLLSRRHKEKESRIQQKKVSKEFACNICTRKCSSKLALQRHMGTHTGIKPFHCQHCDYKTRLKASLIQHMRVHTGEKPFKCTICQYASIDASSLRRHSRTHSTEKPYKCQLCSYSCIQKKSLDLHVRRHHTGERFRCHFCDYSSPDKQLLQKHLKKHQKGVEESIRSIHTEPIVKSFTI
ncbi:uncharacterized protein [Mobula birostris]|uniref:uncharacterized protein n=1 Tax=Mobula birostris TaxID=1983395 RepID=UPI003B28A86D